MMFIRQSTSIDVPIGPFLDSGDGNTVESGLTITQPDVRLKKNGGAWAQKAAAQTLTHEEAGWYEVTLDSTDTDTVGHLVVAIHESGALPVWREFQVVEEAVYDALFAASALGYVANAPVNVAQFGGSNGTFSGGRPEVNTSHAAGTAWNSGAIGASTLASDTIAAAKIASGAITSAKFAAGAIDAAAIADGAIDRATFAVDTGLQTVRSNTAQAGGATSITLDASASSTTDFYKHCLVYLTGGTGVGQFRIVTAYNGTTKVATVTPAWATNPDATSTFAVLPAGLVNVEAFGGSAGTFASGRPEVNASHWGGTAVGSTEVRANLINIAGSAVNTSSAQLGVNVVNFGGSAGTFSSGRPEVNTTHWGGTAVASATVRSDLINIAGAAVSTSTAQLGVNVVQISGDATAADNLETMLDGTGGQTLTLKSLRLENTVDTNSALYIGNSSGIPVQFYSGDNEAWRMTTNATDKQVILLLSASSTHSPIGFSTGSDIMPPSIVGGLQADSGTTTTLTDAIAAGYGTDRFKGDWLQIHSGTNQGARRIITAYNTTTGQFTFAPALANAIAADVYYSIIPAGRVDLHSILGTVSPATAGYVAPDWGQIANPTTTVNLSGTTVKTATDIATQIGALNNITAASVVTAMGTGTFLTAIPWNASWNAEVQSEVEDALGANGANLTAVQLADAEDVYHADIDLSRDVANTQDEYTVRWFKNGVRIASGITSPTIQVIKRADGTDLIASTAMTEIGSTGAYKYTETSSRISAGEAVIVSVAGTIDSSSRRFERVISRDST